MTGEPSKEKSETAVQAEAKRELLAASFAEVFGHERTRTGPQRLVLGHLALCAGDDGNSYRFNEAKDGLALVAAGIHRDGARSILRVIERQIGISEKKRKPGGKPKTIRNNATP